MTTPHLSAIFTERSWADLALTERAVQQVDSRDPGKRPKENEIDARIPLFILRSTGHRENIDCCINR